MCTTCWCRENEAYSENQVQKAYQRSLCRQRIQIASIDRALESIFVKDIEKSGRLEWMLLRMKNCLAQEIGVLTLVKKEFTRISAVWRGGNGAGGLISDGKETTFSTMFRCRGSVVNGDAPLVFSMHSRKRWRQDRFAESPT